MNEILRFMQVYHPTPLKRVWLALVITGVLLKLWVAWRERGWGVRAFFLMASISSALRMSTWWGFAGEASMGAVGLMLACDLQWRLNPPPVRRFPARYLSQSNRFMGLACACLLGWAAPPPYPGFTAAGYYARLFSDAAAVGMLAAAIARAVTGRSTVRHPDILRGVLALLWLAAAMVAYLSRSTGDARWHARMAMAVWQVGILTVWCSCRRHPRQPAL